jgi:radical SAM protein with 4Fe4S-binding SPASM domain
MECVETLLSDSEYIAEFNRKSAQLRVPLSGSLDLTRRCNLRCVHCYLGGGSGLQGEKEREMSTGRILSIIDEITEAGCLFLLITGGEPLIREDFPEIYAHAKKKGLLVTVFTNGTLLNEKLLGLFGELPPQVVEISLYGASASTYEKITGVRGSYERCISAVRKLLSMGINVRLKTILMTLNSQEFGEIEDLAREFGVKFRFDAAIFPRFNGDKTPLSLRVSSHDAVEKEFSDPDRARGWARYIERFQGQAPSSKLYNCGAGVTGFHIDACGRLQPCVMATTIQFDMLNGSFLEGWQTVLSGVLDKEPGDAYACNTCEKRHLCGFCPAFFLLENGREDALSEYLCAIGNHRFELISNNKIQGELNGT